jgi:ubiquinone/menaquinone biosynthesis C-methylase UbiE
MPPSAESRDDAPSESERFDRYARTYGDAVNASIAITGDSVDDFARIKAELVARELSSAEGLRILDFGCGTGLSTRALSAALPDRRQLVGVDPSVESISVAKQHGRDSIGYEVLDGHTLPFADGSFDVVFTACVFHHIDRREHMRWLAELRRVLTPDGSLFLFEHNPLNPLTRCAVRECPFDEGVVLLSASYARRIARAAGFSVSGAAYYYFFPRALAALRPLEPALGWCPLGAQYFIRARTRDTR